MKTRQINDKFIQKLSLIKVQKIQKLKRNKVWKLDSNIAMYVARTVDTLIISLVRSDALHTQPMGPQLLCIRIVCSDFGSFDFIAVYNYFI